MEHGDPVVGASYLRDAPGGPGILSWSKNVVRLWNAGSCREVVLPVRVDNPIVGAPILMYGQPAATRLLIFNNEPHLFDWPQKNADIMCQSVQPASPK
jgi:hypothetical protein